MSQAISLLGELEAALTGGSQEKRVATLRQVTDLFLGEAERLTEQQIGLFDDVLMHLIEKIETKALVQLSNSLAHVASAPSEVARSLARNAEISIAGPILTNSARLSDTDLIEVARSRSQRHLAAISGRTVLTEAVTDVLIERGDNEVVHTLAANAGARFSDNSFAALVKKSEADVGLVERLGRRLDIPLHLLRQLLVRATDIVRSRLLASAPPELQVKIQSALAEIIRDTSLADDTPRDYTAAEGKVQELNRQGKLNEKTFLAFALANKQEEMITALALFCGTSTTIIEQLLKSANHDGPIIACKGAKLSLPTFFAVLKARFAGHQVSEYELELARESFLNFSQASAQRTIRFLSVQKATKTG